MEPRRIKVILQDMREWSLQVEDHLQVKKLRQTWDEIWKRILYEQLNGIYSEGFDSVCNKIRSILHENQW
jgi:hypothetical protein